MIMIAQASSSETGTEYGTPPNQLRTAGKLDGELNVIPFYPFGFEAVFRAKDGKIAWKIADLAYRIVSNGAKVGYGQQTEGVNARTGLFDALFAMAVPEPEKIISPVNCDCSSFAGACAYFAGVYSLDLRTMNTTTAPARLMNSGYFARLEDESLLNAAVGCKAGDIFWKHGHMLICLDTNDIQETEPMRVWNCSACHLRTGPSKYDSHIEYMHPGDIVAVISRTENGWSHVSTEFGEGYVSNKYLVKLPRATVVNGNVWMRSVAGVIKPETEILVISSGERPWLTGETKKIGSTTWYQCIYAGRTGWASGKYLIPD